MALSARPDGAACTNAPRGARLIDAHARGTRPDGGMRNEGDMGMGGCQPRSAAYIPAAMQGGLGRGTRRNIIGRAGLAALLLLACAPVRATSVPADDQGSEVIAAWCDLLHA